MPSDVSDKIHAQFSTYPFRQYPKGQILIFSDENPEHVFYIVEGRVRKYDVSYRGDEVIINVFKSPSFFPMSWAINHTPNRYFYKTETPVKLHVIPAEDTMAFLQQNPDVTLDLLSRVYHGLEGMYGRLVRLMSGTARSRLIYEIIVDCGRFGEELAGGKIRLKSSEVDLAARSGLSRETVSREMHKLKDNKWVEVTKDGIVVCDLEQLKNALGSEV